MASKFGLHSRPFLLLLLDLVQTLPTFQMLAVSNEPRKEHVLMFKPSETSVIINVDEIAKAVWDAAAGRYKIMSPILQNHLSSVVPYGSPYIPRRPGYDRTVVTVYSNNTITIFVPPDESFTDDADWKTLEYQFVTAKVDKEAFDSGSIPTGSELLTCHFYCNVIVNGYGSINNVTIRHWNIYNDGHIIVLGVQDFFNCEFWYHQRV